jgi:hypothetical protein
MPGILEFNDFVKSTGQATLGTVDKVLNESTRNTLIVGKLLKGAGWSRVLKGGKTIQDFVMFDDPATYRDYDPMEPDEWKYKDVMQDHSIPWKFSKDHTVWTEQDIELNDNTEHMTREGWFQMFKRLRDIKFQAMWTSFNQGWDAAFGRQALSVMETGSKVPYSLHFLVNDWTNGIVTAAGAGTAYTTIQGFAPATNPKWRVQQSTYAQDPRNLAPGEDWDLFDAMEQAHQLAGFANLPVHGSEAAVNPDGSRGQPDMILTQLDGRRNYQVGLRRSNDTLLKKQDGSYPGPAWADTPIYWWSLLDTVVQYDSTDAAGWGTFNGALTKKKGPRYMGINSQFLFPVLHNRMYAKLGEVKEHPNQEGVFRVSVKHWHNTFARSLKRQFIVTPSATLS